jgi:23S rRNA pseudouridine1911/1915/1917 synthase
MTDYKKPEEEEENNDLFEHYNFEADAGQTLLRIDKFLLGRIENTSRNKIQNVILAGNVLVNDKVVKANYKVRPMDKISLVMPYPPRETEVLPENIPLEIVYEDDDVLVINKPAGLVVHPGYANYTGTLVNALVYHFGNLPSSSELAYRPGLVHRLDKNTSGIMVVAKTEIALSSLAKQFFDRTISRKYFAMVWGRPKLDEGIIEGNVGRSHKNRKIMDVFAPDTGIGKHAITHYKIEKPLGYVSIVECKLETGRTHQIRVHMKHLGHPLFNDDSYGGDKILKGLPTANYKRFVQNCFALIPGQALHAKTLEFSHPKTGERMKFNSELPQGYLDIIDKFERAEQTT